MGAKKPRFIDEGVLLKVWGGRFEKKTDRGVEEFTESLSFDRRLFSEDIAGSIAHARMLGSCGILPEKEAKDIIAGLKEIEKEIADGRFVFDLSDEDIHMSIERALTDKIGPVGGKLHTARSRNDQVVLDMRIYLKKEIKIICALLANLQHAQLDLARANLDVVMPGYTHLQRAQPVLFAHHQMAHFFCLSRDFDRLKACFERTDIMPLGSGALAGTSFPIDRQIVADELDFSRISENSIDATSDRDFILEFLSAASITMLHLSRIAEEVILWATKEFGFIELDDSYTTGSSMMPQKKNPDVVELVRGKAARVFANMTAVLVTLKALPLAYNRDLQEDKEPVFDTIDNLKMCLSALTGMLSTMQINQDAMEKAASTGFSTATDAADYLTKKGLPFRQAHETVGRLVRFCISEDRALLDLEMQEFKRFSELFEEDIFDVLDIRKSVESKTSYGGTSVTSVRQQFRIADKNLARESSWSSSQ
jgi:argininosuccinate lyase